MPTNRIVITLVDSSQVCAPPCERLLWREDTSEDCRDAQTKMFCPVQKNQHKNCSAWSGGITKMFWGLSDTAYELSKQASEKWHVVSAVPTVETLHDKYFKHLRLKELDVPKRQKAYNLILREAGVSQTTESTSTLAELVAELFAELVAE